MVPITPFIGTNTALGYDVSSVSFNLELSSCPLVPIFEESRSVGLRMPHILGLSDCFLMIRSRLNILEGKYRGDVCLLLIAHNDNVHHCAKF